MLRGTLDVHSEVGKGSTFRLTLPPTIDARVSRAIEQVVDAAVERDGVGEEPESNGARPATEEAWTQTARPAGSSSA